jgi:hypothetical protein
MGNKLASVSRMNMAVKNQLAALGRGLIENKKPIGLGFAGSLALAMVLSRPKDVVGPGSQFIGNANVNMNVSKSANRLKPEDLAPQQEPIGSPTAPNMMNQHTVRMAPNDSGTDTLVKAQTSNTINAGRISSSIGNFSKSGNVSVNIRDHRRNNSSNHIMNKLM